MNLNKQKVMLVASTASMIKQFNQKNIRTLQEMGYKVVVATNFEKPGTITKNASIDFFEQLKSDGVEPIQVNFERGIGGLFSNYAVSNQIQKKLASDNFAFVHTETPIGGVIGRWAAWRKKVPSIYIAHGFHFFTKGPLINWFAFPVEYFFARITNVLVTINQEDFARAKRFFKADDVEIIDGAGRDIKSAELYQQKNKSRLLPQVRNRLNIPENGIVMLSVGELSKRKNHQIVIQAVKQVGADNLYYIIAGLGDRRETLQMTIDELGLNGKVILIGYSEAIGALSAASDFAILPSLREGLATAGIEELADGLPLIGSNLRGIKDYIVNGENGYLINPKDQNNIASTIALMLDAKNREWLSKNTGKNLEKYDFKNVEKQMKEIYSKIGTIKKTNGD